MSEKKGKVKGKKKFTTIAVDLELRQILRKLARGNEPPNSVIKRLVARTVDVFVGFILVDNELPQSHTVVFQLGEEKDSLYIFDGSKTTNQDMIPITLEEVQNLLKEPKPNMTITRKEAFILRKALVDTKQWKTPLYSRITNFTVPYEGEQNE